MRFPHAYNSRGLIETIAKYKASIFQCFHVLKSADSREKNEEKFTKTATKSRAKQMSNICFCLLKFDAFTPAENVDERQDLQIAITQVSIKIRIVHGFVKFHCHPTEKGFP